MSETKDKAIDQQRDAEFPPMPLLENWRAGQFGLGLEGNVYGHPEFPDGEYVHTTPLKWINEVARLAETASRMYRLGKKA